MLPRPLVIRLAAVLGLEDDAFLIGGQALNLWAERYSHRAELAEFGPYTSKDMDYFGRVDAAAKLARALNGRLKLPDIDTATPNTAVVAADMDGMHLEIDFLNHVLGVEPNLLQRLAVEISVPVEAKGEKGFLMVPIMHPLHCLQSRLANVLRLGRTGDTAMRQLQASAVVLDAYVEEMLTEGHPREVMATVRALFAYLKTDKIGRKAHKYLRYDPLLVLSRLATDERLDVRYRSKTLAPMIVRLRRIRSSVWPSLLEGMFVPVPEEVDLTSKA